MLTRELSLEILPGDEKRASLLVEAGIELQRKLTQLFALCVVGQNGELRVGRPQGKLLTVEAEPRSEQRILECVLVPGDHSLDEPPLAGLAQAVEPLALVTLGRLLRLAQQLELRPREEIRVAGHDRSQLRELLLADPHGANLLALVPVVVA